ncbi:MAG TPA: hypothetical protein VFW40_08490 [Capsulimonadaceae bacterium]|nr:hypothetical protein [Capsulimonadaceae bacterium]
MRRTVVACRRPSPVAGFGIAVLLLMSSAAQAAAPNARPVPHHAGNDNALRLFLAGPSVILLLLASIAVVVLIAAGTGSLEKLVGLGTRAMRRMETGLVAPTLWGLCVGLLVFALVAMLFKTKVLAVLGAVVIVFAFCLLGMGICVAATVYGRGIALAAGSVELEDLSSMRLGLWTFLLASAIPFIGWIVILFATAAGLGAIVQCFTQREPSLPT